MGPASSKKNTLRAMMRAGMDIARFNFSHGSHEEHRGRVDMVKNLREELNIPVALLLDTKGPEIRTKLLKDHKKITLEAGSEFTLTTGDIEGDETRVAITYENLYKDVKKGGSAGNHRKLTPYVSAAFKPFQHEEFRIRFFYKDIFRLASFNDLYYEEVGNTQLKPEKAKQYNIGLTYNKNVCPFLPYLSLTVRMVYKQRVTEEVTS